MVHLLRRPVTSQALRGYAVFLQQVENESGPDCVRRPHGIQILFGLTNRDILIYDGNDVIRAGDDNLSNILSCFNAVAPVVAKTSFGVGDGQTFPDRTQIVGSLEVAELGQTVWNNREECLRDL